MNIKFFPVTILIVFLIISCNNNKEIISQKKMTKVLLELHLAESLAQQLPKDSLQIELKNTDSLNKYSSEILKQNGISEKQFLESMHWYKDNPEILDSIYQNILSQIAILNSQKS